MLPEICEVGVKTIISAGSGSSFVPNIPRKSGQYLIVTNFAPLHEYSSAGQSRAGEVIRRRYTGIKQGQTEITQSYNSTLLGNKLYYGVRERAERFTSSGESKRWFLI